MKRLFLIVLDSVGIGALPDAARFGDMGADTMGHISKSEKFDIPNLCALGIGNIEGLGYLVRQKSRRLLTESARKAPLARTRPSVIGK